MSRAYISERNLVRPHVTINYMNRKSHMGSPMAPSHLTFNDLERSKSRSLRCSVIGDLYIVHVPVVLSY